MPGSHLSRCQGVIYYSCELQYILYISARVCVPMTGSFTASTSPAKWQQLFCRLQATPACFSSPSGAGESTTVLGSSSLLPFVCPLHSIHAAWRVSSCEKRPILGVGGWGWRGWRWRKKMLREGKETSACRCWFGPLTKPCLTCCQDNCSTLRNGEHQS